MEWLANWWLHGWHKSEEVGCRDLWEAIVSLWKEEGGEIKII